ncbi:MAG: glutathione S-transferase family protein [Alphaproteobacteria bacterium]
MRRLVHITLSPACRMARLVLGEKRLACDLVQAEDPLSHLPVFVDLDGRMIAGLWAIIDHLEGAHSELVLVPDDPVERAETLRLLDWAMTNFHEFVTKRIAFEKGTQTQTGSASRRAPNMETVRMGRDALRAALAELSPLAEARGFLAGRDLSLADLSLAAHLSVLDYFGEVPWAEAPAITEWYTRIKSRPSFRPLLSDRVPGQPPALHYAELDF